MNGHYKIKVSTRARYLRLKLSFQEGLVVIVPKGFDIKRVPGILEKKKRWIQKVTARHQKALEALSSQSQPRLPEQIELLAIKEKWMVDYELIQTTEVVVIEQSEKRLLVQGNIENVQRVKESLLRWVTCKTYTHISPWLLRLAEEKNFSVNRVVVKSQRTRWASCSMKKTISLNLRLLFLPEDVVRYVLLHELVHTRQMNHSRRFWAEVAAVEPDFANLHAQLRQASQMVPVWLNP